MADYPRLLVGCLNRRVVLDWLLLLAAPYFTVLLGRLSAAPFCR